MSPVSLAALAALVLAGCSRPVAVDAKDAAPPAVKEGNTSSASAHPGKVDDAPKPAETTAVKIVVAPDDVDALSLVRTKRLEAKAEGRTLVVYAGAGWCPPCKQFRAELASGRLDAKLAKVTLLVFDVDKDGDRLGSAGYTFQYIPYVAVPGPDGKPRDSAQATGKGADAWRALLAKLEAWQTDPGR